MLLQQSMHMEYVPGTGHCSQQGLHKSLAFSQGFPGGLVVKNPAVNAGDTGSIPGPGRFHVQLSPRATTTEPVL